MATINVGVITVPDEVAVSINTWRQGQTKKTTALVAAINASTTALQLEDSTGIAIGDHLMIEAEELIVTGAGAASRAAVQTVAAAHAAGAAVRALKYATNVALAKEMIKRGVIQIVQSIPTASVEASKAVIATEEAKIKAAEELAVT